MAMTLRLSERGETRLETLSACTGLSKTAVVEQALEDWDARAERRARIRAVFAQTMERDAELLDLLSK